MWKKFIQPCTNNEQLTIAILFTEDIIATNKFIGVGKGGATGARAPLVCRRYM